MESATRRELVELLRGRGLAALGTIHGDAPLVSMVLYATSPDLSALFIHVSHLAQHTTAMLGNNRVGLLITELESPGRNPLSMARVSVEGVATFLQPNSFAYEQAKAAYIAAHPTAAINFDIGGFYLFRINISSGRFIAGFGKIVDVGGGAWGRLTEE